MKKRILSLALALVMVLITIVIPSSVTVSASGNGYSSISFKYNGKYYSGNLTTHYDPAKGGWTSFYTEAAITVDLDAPIVEYDTIRNGYLKYTGKPVSGVPDEETFTIRTKAVPCGIGMSQVINYRSIYGYVTIRPNGVKLTTSVLGTPA